MESHLESLKNLWSRSIRCLYGASWTLIKSYPSFFTHCLCSIGTKSEPKAAHNSAAYVMAAVGGNKKNTTYYEF